MVKIPKDTIERIDSGSGQVSTNTDGLMARDVTMRWLVHSIEDYSMAEEKAATLAPLYYDGHVRTSLVVRPVGAGWYEIEANYGNSGIPAYPENSGFMTEFDVEIFPAGLSVDTTTKNEHITTAWVDNDGENPICTGYAAEGETAPESEGAINVSGGRVGGIDVAVPSFSWTETWLIPAWFLISGTFEPRRSDSMLGGIEGGEPYAITLHDMGGSVNEEYFRLFNPGEVLFLGAKFDTSRSSTLVPVSFSFTATPNRKNFKIGGVTVAKKDGQDYMWVQYGDASTGGSPVKRAKYVYVDQVYPRKDFGKLQIGQDWPRFYLVGSEKFYQPMFDEYKGKA
jgi:hypothetical protein